MFSATRAYPGRACHGDRLRSCLLLLLAACAAPTDARPRLTAADRPTDGVFGVAWVELDLPWPAPAALEIDDGRRIRQVWLPPADEAQTVPLVGLGGGRTVTVTAHVHGLRPSPPLALDLPPLPPHAPTIEVLAHEPDAVEPGFLLFGLRANDPEVPSAVVALDEDLEVALWMEAEPPVGDLRLSPGGRLQALVAGDYLERTLCGDVTLHVGPSEHAALGLDVPDGLHHEGFPLPDGTVVALASERRTVDGVPVDYPTPDRPEPPLRTADVRDQLVVHFDRDGTVLRQVSMLDLLDPQRVSHDGLSQSSLGLDWAHANGLAVDPRDGSWVVSLRHQDALVQVRSDGTLGWILGDPSGWRAPWAEHLLQPVGPADWAYHHHAPEVHADGTLLVFDNHNRGATPWGEPPAAQPPSRLIAWHVDAARGTVEALWTLDQTATGPLYAAVVGDADLQPTTGNVLRNYGILRHEPGGPAHARVVEQHPDRPDAVLLDIAVTVDAPGGANMWRVEKVPTLMPGTPAALCPAHSPRSTPGG